MYMCVCVCVCVYRVRERERERERDLCKCVCIPLLGRGQPDTPPHSFILLRLSGGNPVCAAAGLAVLETIQREKLREHASAVGAALRAALGSLALESAGALIGDVRGAGLFVGVEFVTDRESRKPATAETSRLCSRLLTVHRILTSIDGPHNNVIVIKPPLCFSAAQACRLVDAMRTELLAMKGVDLGSFSHTPT